MTQLIVIVMTKPCKRERFGWDDSVNGNFLSLLMTELGNVPIIPTHVAGMEACRVIIHHRQIRSTQHCWTQLLQSNVCRFIVPLVQQFLTLISNIYIINIEHLILFTMQCFAGLSCHSCNSIYDRRCGDPYDAYTTEIVDCEQVNTIRFAVGIFFRFLSDIGELFTTWRVPSIFCLKSWLLLNWWYFCHRSGGSWPMWTELRALQHFVERQCRQVQCADF